MFSSNFTSNQKKIRRTPNMFLVPCNLPEFLHVGIRRPKKKLIKMIAREILNTWMKFTDLNHFTKIWWTCTIFVVLHDSCMCGWSYWIVRLDPKIECHIEMDIIFSNMTFFFRRIHAFLRSKDRTTWLFIQSMWIWWRNFIESLIKIILHIFRMLFLCRQFLCEMWSHPRHGLLFACILHFVCLLFFFLVSKAKKIMRFVLGNTVADIVLFYITKDTNGVSMLTIRVAMAENMNNTFGIV